MKAGSRLTAHGAAKGRAIAATFAAFMFVATIFATSAQAQTYSVVYNFAGGTGDGEGPYGSLTQDSAGNIYGVTLRGGALNQGSIFKFDPSTGTETLLHSFTNGNDGAVPLDGVFVDTDGSLYGTTSTGGDSKCKCGVVYKLDTSNTLTVLHSFTGVHDGRNPNGRLVSIDGELYGTTANGYGTGSGSGCGGVGCGEVFRVSKMGLYTHSVYTFTGGADGSGPEGLIRDAAGNLYGTTDFSTSGGGTVFKIGVMGGFFFSTLYGFTGSSDGREPFGRLIIDSDGNVHGVTEFGGDMNACNDLGPGGCGVLFRVTPAGTETVVHQFFGNGGGALPVGGLVDLGGVLYGSTSEGGSTAKCIVGCGLLYQVGKTGEYSVIHTFSGGDDGGGSAGTPLLDADGNIYGTASGGTGSCVVGPITGCGVIYKITP
jgi:uncharacterized repeat protein (TIGR03803 family)